jgi:hypothetical protein
MTKIVFLPSTDWKNFGLPFEKYRFTATAGTSVTWLYHRRGGGSKSTMGVRDFTKWKS